MRPEDIMRGRQFAQPVQAEPEPEPESNRPVYESTSVFSTPRMFAPQTLAEWKLCKPGDIIRLLGFTVEITEENYNPFMREIMWYVNYWIGDRVANWTFPNNDPGKVTRFYDVTTRMYIANGIYKTLAKYACEKKEVGFFEGLQQKFFGVQL